MMDKKKSKYFAIILAGGVGSRLWPKSRKEHPKQFQDFMGSGKSLLQHTIERISFLVPKENFFILTNVIYKELVLEQLSGFKENQVLLEPCMRNTAPPLLYASLKINKINPNAQVLVAPSDHWITESDIFISDIEKAFNHCIDNEHLITFGIKPTQPHTGYGYLEVKKNEKSSITKVLKFKEKPDFNLAQSYVNSNNFLWNSGIFAWNVKTILKSFKFLQPEMYTLFINGLDVLNTPLEQDFIESNYHKAKNISVDYAIMEKAENVSVILASFNWSDLGTWNALYEQGDKDNLDNVTINTRAVFKESKNNIVFSKTNKLVVLNEINDFIVIDDDDVLLVYPKNKDGEIKELLKKVNAKYGDEFE